MDNLYRLTAFPKTSTGGNKAGVYLYADNLAEKQMQAIAHDVGYSETAFVMKSKLADFKVRFFTPFFEVDLCGHATIATFNLLRELKIVTIGSYTQETKAGILKLDVEEDMVFMQQVKPKFDQIIPLVEIQECFADIEFNNKFSPQVVSTGLREIFIPIKNIDILNNMNPNMDSIKRLSSKYNVIGMHAFALDTINNDVDAYGRNFVPIVGINEESATGTSNGALGCYLYQYFQKKEKYILRQGYNLNQPSEIITKISAQAGQINEVWVGGTAYIIEK